MVSRFRFVEDHRDSCEVKWLCELLEVGRSSYYDRGSKRQGRAVADAALTEQIRVVHETAPAMGTPRITAELNGRFRELSRWVNRITSRSSDACCGVSPATGGNPGYAPPCWIKPV